MSTGNVHFIFKFDASRCESLINEIRSYSYKALEKVQEDMNLFQDVEIISSVIHKETSIERGKNLEEKALQLYSKLH